MKKEWANSCSKQAPMLMYAVSFGTIATINIILEAGAMKERRLMPNVCIQRWNFLP